MVVPRRYTALLAALLFLVFGAKMLKDGLEMTSGTSSVQDEIKEVEQELQEKDFTSPNAVTTTTISPLSSPSVAPDTGATHPAEALEAGTAWKPRRRGRAGSVVDRAGGGVLNLLNLLFSPVFVQTFIMTFLGEWGDRSQIATITLAAASGTLSPPPTTHTHICTMVNGDRFLVCYDGDSDCAWMLYCSCCCWWTTACK
jgi:putative Ca2+/H+ antiporter (TMEM165/GDT1 family)